MHYVPENYSDKVRSKLSEAAMAVYHLEVQRRMEEGPDFKRNPAREAIILHGWQCAYLYSRHFVGGRWQAFEDAISDAAPIHDADDIRAIYNYVRHMRGSRMVSAEKHIANDARSAVDYSQHVLGRPWDDSMEDGEHANETIHRKPAESFAYSLGM